MLIGRLQGLHDGSVYGFQERRLRAVEPLASDLNQDVWHRPLLSDWDRPNCLISIMLFRIAQPRREDRRSALGRDSHGGAVGITTAVAAHRPE